MRVMFVCTGNTCRSAVAEEVFRGMAGDDIEVFSSGIAAENGRGPSQNTVEVCRAHGIDITSHSATYFRDAPVREMDLVLTFEQFQSQKIKTFCPDCDVCTIREYIGEYPPDIADPFGGDYEVYEACFLEIVRVLEKVVKMIK